MKKLLFVLSIIFLSTFSQGQCVGNCTSVTATLQDTTGQVWANALVTATIVPPFGNPAPLLNNGVPIADPINSVQANNSGVFTVSLDNNVLVTPANSQWKLVICPNATVTNCTITLVTIFGSSQDLSSQLNPILVVPTINVNPTIFRAYNDSEAFGGYGTIYLRTNDNTFRSCQLSFCNGTGWSAFVAGSGNCNPTPGSNNAIVYLSSNGSTCVNSPDLLYIPSAGALEVGQSADTGPNLGLFGAGGTVQIFAPIAYASNNTIFTPGNTIDISGFNFVGAAQNINPFIISSISSTTNVVTVTCVSCNYIVGLYVTIQGVTDSSFNGHFKITSVANGSFTYSLVGTNRSSSGGFAFLYTAGYDVFANAGSANHSNNSLYFYADANTDISGAGTGMQFVVGTDTTTNSPGGPINLYAGNSVGNAGGGSINLYPGSPLGGSSMGVVKIGRADGTIPIFTNLPVCTSSFEGGMMPVSDSTTNVWGATITGSGTSHVLAYCDGTNWTVMGK